jgi:peptidoglycan-binding protein ArfA
MGGSDEAPETTEWRTTSKFYRRFPGLPWLVSLIVIPLLLAIIGYGVLDRSRSEVGGPTGALPTLNAPTSPGGAPKTPTIPAVSLTPVSIVRSGDDIKLSGDFPSDEAKTSLLDALKASFGPNVNIVDNLRINPDVTSLDFSHAAPIFKAAASVPDFGLAVKGDTVTLSGTAGSGAQQEAIEQAANAAWPNLNIVDTMGIKGPVAPAPAPTSGGSACAHLRSDITALGPITFPSGGTTLTQTDEQTLNRVADKLKACPGVKVAINGYTDNTGSDDTNISLSSNRADAVADYLIARGVTRDHLTAKGFGSADPIADNNTSDGQAKNRRVEILVK